MTLDIMLIYSAFVGHVLSTAPVQSTCRLNWKRDYVLYNYDKN